MIQLDQSGKLSLSLEHLLGESIAVLGIKGSGKSNTAAVLAEEMLASGLPLALVDIAGEYWGLRARYPILVLGRGPQADLEIAPGHGSALAEFSLRQSVPLILDLGDFSTEERLELLESYFEQLWRVAGELRRPYAIFLEEAHNFIPQAGASTALRGLKETLTRIATEGRKRGLGIVMVGQRSARLDKNVLSQAGILLLHHVRHPADVGVYQELIPRARAWVKQTTHSLATGQAIAMVADQVEVIEVRQRHTYHAGYTPGLEALPAPEFQRLDEAQVGELRALLDQHVAAPPETGELDALRAELDEERTLRQALEAEVERLRTQNAILSGLRVEVVAGGEMQVEALHTAQLLVAGQTHQSEVIPMQPGTANPGAAPIPAAPPPREAAVLPHRTALATKRAMQRQQRLFQTMLREIWSLPKMQRAILSFLLEREGQTFSLTELARFAGYSLSSLSSNPPTRLIELGLIERTGRNGRAFRHQATARQEFAHRFPDLNVEQLLEELLDGLPT